MRRLARTKPGISLPPQVKYNPDSKNQELWRRYTRMDRNPPGEGKVSSVSTKLFYGNHQSVDVLYSPESDKNSEMIVIRNNNLRAVLSLGREKSQMEIFCFNLEKPTSFTIICNHQTPVLEKQKVLA